MEQTNDAHATKQEDEYAMLLDVEQTSYDTAASTDEGDVTTESSSEPDEQEISEPWPATFGRSAEILAKPIVGLEEVVRATESMRVLPPTKLRKNTSLTGLDRGWRTPDPASGRRHGAGTKRQEDDDDDEEEGTFWRMGIAKNFSLDWRLRPGGPAVLSEKKRRSAEEIRAHKMRILHGESKTVRTLRAEMGEEEDVLKGTELESNEEGVVDHELKDGSKTSFFGCVCNVSNTLLGIGILSLPFVFRMCGWLGGMFAILTFGAITWWTALLLGRALNGDPRPSHVFQSSSNSHAKSDLRRNEDNSSSRVVRLRKPIQSFPAIAREAFGQRGTVLLSTAMYFELFSCLAVFLISLGEHLQSLFPAVSVTAHMVLVSIILMVATVFFKTPRLISYLSFVGTVTTVCVVLTVFAAALWKGDLTADIARQTQQLQQSHSTVTTYVAPPPPRHDMWITSGLPIGFGLVAFCFSGHAIIPSIYNSMEAPQQFERMISLSFALTLICCIAVASSGYYMFGSAVSDQITISLFDAPIEDAASAMTVLTWLMIGTVFSKFSLYIFPLALGVEEIIAPYAPTDLAMELSYAIIKFVLIVSALCVAIFLPSFSFLCSLVGLVCSMIVSVIFPAAAHLKLFGSHLPAWERVVDWAFVVGGVIFGVVGTIATIQ